MSGRDKNNLSIVDVMETLTELAEINSPEELSHFKEPESNVFPLDILEDTENTQTIQILFKTVLHYLKKVYEKDQNGFNDPHNLENIKQIMVMVREAVKKLNKYTKTFKLSTPVNELKEYKQLQRFYISKINKPILDDTMGKWILAVSQENYDYWKKFEKFEWAKEHHIVDLDGLRRDQDYELFFIKKEDGSKFYNPRLLKNIKLICEFSENYNSPEDPFLQLHVAFQHYIKTCAQNLIQSCKVYMDRYYRETAKHKDKEPVSLLNRAFMALMLCSHVSPSIIGASDKTCASYFADFQYFFRKVITHKDYQKMVLYAYDSKYSESICHIVEKICKALFTNMHGLQESMETINELITTALSKKEHKKTDQISTQILHEYEALTKLMKLHPNGPLTKVVNLLDRGVAIFDAFKDLNLPNSLFTLYYNQSKSTVIKLPCPTFQEYIHKCTIAPEFITYLRVLKGEEGNHLLINLQDRTSWREHARSAALEDLQRNKEFENVLTVVTLSTNTEFYFQMDPYHSLNAYHEFIEVFKDQLFDHNSGYLIPEKVHEIINSSFVDKLCHAIHMTFFSGKNVLSKNNRIHFIELFYLFLTLKCIDALKPYTFSFTCKDSLDCSAAYGAQIFLLYSFLRKEEFDEHDRNRIRLLIHGPALLYRERLVLAEPFYRIQETIKVIEALRNENGFRGFKRTLDTHFSSLYNNELLDAELKAI